MIKGFNLFSSKNYLWLAITVAMVLVLWIQIPRILDPNSLEEDLRTLYWIHRYQEPNLFPTVQFEELGVIDIQIGSWTFVNETSAPAYSLMFQLVSYLIPPILFSKLLAFPLMFAAVYYLFRIGEKISDKGTALVLSLAFIILILASHSEISVLSGLHRSFAVPLTLALVYYLLEERFRPALVVLFITGVIYLPIFPVALMTYAFCLIRLREDGRWQLKIQWRQMTELLLVAFLVMVAVSPTIYLQISNVQNETGSTNGGEYHLLEDPHFQKDGRRPLFESFPFVGRGGLTTALRDGFQLLLLVMFAIIILIVLRKTVTKVPPVVMKLVYASLLGFTLAWGAIFLTSSLLLYLPSRHSRVGLFLFLLFFVGLNIQETARIIGGWILRNRQKLLWYMLPLTLLIIVFVLNLPSNSENDQGFLRGSVSTGLLVGLAILLLILNFLMSRKNKKSGFINVRLVPVSGKPTRLILGTVVFIVLLFYLRLMIPNFYSPPESSFDLFNYVKTLPKDALLAGSPCILDNIPFYGKRAVLFNCERFMPDSDVILGNFRSLYASEGEKIYSFCRDYGVSHLVIDETMFQQEFLVEGDYFFEPFNSMLAPELRGRSDFILSNVPEEEKLFQDGSIFVIACNSFVMGLSTSNTG